MNLTVFEAFLITHFVMDWIFQWNWEAMKKSKEWLPLFFHCTVYTAGFIPAFIFFNVNFLWLLLIFVSHVILDKRSLEFWILEKFKGVKKDDVGEPIFTILLIGIDQTLHLAILTLIVIFS